CACVTEELFERALPHYQLNLRLARAWSLSLYIKPVYAGGVAAGDLGLQDLARLGKRRLAVRMVRAHIHVIDAGDVGQCPFVGRRSSPAVASCCVGSMAGRAPWRRFNRPARIRRARP